MSHLKGSDNKRFGYIFYKDTELEMEDDKVVCIKYKGKSVAEIVDSITGFREYNDGKYEDIINKSLVFNFEENKDLEKSLKLAPRESLINSKRKLQGRIERKYSVPKLRKHIDPDTNFTCAGNNVKINGKIICTKCNLQTQHFSSEISSFLD